MTEISKNAEVPQCNKTAVMRSFYFRNTKFIISTICVLGLVYVNLRLPFRVKRIDYGSTFLEAMY
jgi:hypothetical protein